MAAERDRLRGELVHPHDGLARALVRDSGTDAVPASDDHELAPLVARARRGEPGAGEELIGRFLPFISSLAHRYRADGLEHVDLVQEGCVGLLRALARYDAARGVPFPAYATWWIRHALQEARSDFMRPFRLPPKALRQLARLESEHERVYARERREPDTRELDERARVDREQAEALLSADARIRSLEEPIVGTEGEVGTLGELLADPVSADDYEDVLDAIAGQELRALLGRLTERQRDVVNARFGFDRPAERLTTSASGSASARSACGRSRSVRSRSSGGRADRAIFAARGLNASARGLSPPANCHIGKGHDGRRYDWE